MSKIVFLSNIYTPYQHDWLRELSKNNNVLGIFVKEKEKNRNWNIEKDSIFKILSGNLIKKYLSIIKEIHNMRPEHLIIGGYAERGTNLAHLIGALYGAKIYYWAERPIRHRKGILGYLKKTILTIKLGSANKVFAIGELAREYYSQFNKNTINYPYTCDLNDFYNLKRNNENKKVNILFSGQYIERKNVLNLLNAFLNVNDSSLRLTLIGGGDLIDEMRNYSSDSISIKGFMQRECMIKEFQNNDVFILPSKHDGWALVINEALAAGMFVLSNQNVGAFVDFQSEVNCIDCGDTKEQIESSFKKLIHINNIKQKGEENRNFIKNSIADLENSIKFINLQLTS